ncbi:plasma membrane calcium-transporting ATPase 3-like [Bradysia coprophila]|uniref:plasma membrane calcium-transporting ATPase 3-like n=1 Tax=Bradysia coprophila TaxID=38358 RepID=UPI00187DBA02|nr:plasma membrane calcium-transporting ATPase 3-like [Bradysia coprophila]
MGECYRLTLSNLCKLMECSGQEGVAEINKLGGVEGICEQLGTSPSQGITNSIKNQRATFGSNSTSTKARETLWTILGDVFRDKLLMTLLTLFLILPLILFEIHKLLYVVVVLFVTVAFDYFMVCKYRRYFDVRSQTKQTVTVIRNATVTSIVIDDVVVGDVCILNENNVVPADGILIESDGLKLNESFINGMSCYTNKGKHLDAMILCGSEVIAGSGIMVVTAVGANTRKGQITRMMEKRATNGKRKEIDRRESERITFSDESSILRQKIRKLIWKIIYVCLAISGIVFVIFMVWHSVARFVIESRSWSNYYLQFTIWGLVVSISFSLSGIPESILLVVPTTLFLTFVKLYQENIHLRRLDKCETMGSVSSICFDKTGTLTANKMEVVLSHICDHQQTWTTENSQQPLPSDILKLIAENISINSSTPSITRINTDGNVALFGNSTERALLEFVPKVGLNVQTIRDAVSTQRVFHVYPFSSNRKFMGTAISSGNGYRLFIKGASDVVLGKCNFLVGQNGEMEQMTDNLRDHLQNEAVKQIARKRLRTITLAYRDFVTDKTDGVHEPYVDCEPNWDDEVNVVQNLTFLGVLGIDDPIRPEAADTIKSLKSMGITVRMISGDDIETANAVAIKCGISETDGDNGALDATEFNRCIRDKDGVIQQDLFNTLCPNLRVIARASPVDKYNLIDGLKRNGEIVAMVGNSDGDALALKKADIGITLNQLGGGVAKDASTVVLSDDKLDGIVRAVLWGRNCYDSIAKFVQFALSAKVVIVVVEILSTFLLPCEAITFFGIDWFLAIMALVSAFFTHKITNDLSLKRSYGRSESIISKTMWKNVCIQSIYQLLVLISLPFVFKLVFDEYWYFPNVFILMTFFNAFNSRKLFGERNIFDGMRATIPLCVILVGVLFVVLLHPQCVYILPTCSDYYCARFQSRDWIFTTLLGFGILIWHQLLLFCCREKRVEQNISEV